MLTVKEVSRRTGISLALVYREIRTGRLRTHCFGKRAYRVAEEDLAEFLANSIVAVENQPATGARRQSPHSHRHQQFKHIDVSRLLSRQS